MNLNDNFFNQSCDPITAVINARYEWQKNPIYLLIFINKFSFYASGVFFEISFSGKKLTALRT